jgi:glycerophosphoryl diester phosphodiesterase
VVEVIAHRAGNSPEGSARAQASADVLEIDVHLHRGRLVVRHAKRIVGTRRLWERWYLLPARTTVPTLEDALGWIGPGSPLWVDCKGPGALGLPSRVLAAAGPERQVTLSGKAWWVLARGRGRPRVRIVRSAGNRFEALLLRRLPSRVDLDGVALHERLLDADQVARLSGRFGPVFTWGVHDEQRARQLVEWGVDGLILDDPDLMEAVRRIRQ